MPGARSSTPLAIGGSEDDDASPISVQSRGRFYPDDAHHELFNETNRDYVTRRGWHDRTRTGIASWDSALSPARS
jgi:hypothetical protein